MMRPTTRILFAGGLAATVLALGAPNRAVAAHTALAGTGIVVGGGTVQPIGDPHFLYTFYPVSLIPDPAVHDFIAAGDSFTVSLKDMTPILSGTNSQPPDWAASFSSPVPGSTPPEDLFVTWTYIGDTPIKLPTLLDPKPGPFFEVESSSLVFGPGFNYTFVDSLPGDPHDNFGGGTFTVTVVPEPSSIALIGLGVPSALVLVRRSRRRAARA